MDEYDKQVSALAVDNCRASRMFSVPVDDVEVYGASPLIGGGRKDAALISCLAIGGREAPELLLATA